VAITFWKRESKLPLISGSFALQNEGLWERLPVTELTRDTSMKLLLAVCKSALSDQLDLEQIAYWGSDPPIPFANFRCTGGRIRISLLYAKEEHPSAGLRISGEGPNEQTGALRTIQLSVARAISRATKAIGISDITWHPPNLSWSMVSKIET
jgi:hypothetical protein